MRQRNRRFKKNLLKGIRHLKCRQLLAQEPRSQEPLAQEPTAEQQPPAKSNSRAHVFVRHRARPQKCSHFTTAYRKLFFIQSTTHIPSKHMHKRIQPPSPHAYTHSKCLNLSEYIHSHTPSSHYMLKYIYQSRRNAYAYHRP